ncbi:MAG: MFS transporter [Weeksellaceae bacterium]
MRTFYQLLANALLVVFKNNLVWFALTYWIYLETKSVVSTSTLGGLYLVAVSLSGFWLGSLVDHHKKKTVMIGSGFVSLLMFSIGLFIYSSFPREAFSSITSPILWIFASILLAGTLAGNVVGIAIPTLIGSLVPEDKRDKANGMFGTIMGVAFSATSFASGIVLAYGGMVTVLIGAIVCTILAMVHLLSVSIEEKKIIHTGEEQPKKIDVKGTIKAISAVPGLFALIFFTTFNNFMGGVFMSLMDAYGLSLVSVQTWGIMWGVLSFSMIFGGMYVAKNGLGPHPLKRLFKVNIITWTTCIFFTIQPSIILLAIGMAIWMFLMPSVEATEQTIIQKVVPPERMGRIFGFAQSIEQAASPVTAFLIGPIAQFIFIPYMTTGSGVDLIGDWFGVGTGRGIALVFMIAGAIGLLVTLIAMRSGQYKLLAKRYEEKK